MKNKVINKFNKVFLYSLVSFIILGILYPENFIFSEIRFTSSHTSGNYYQSALFHAKYINNFNFNFWNFFDQANTTFYHLAQGFYNLTSLTEGLVYNFLKFFKSENFFRSFHFFFIQFTFILFRTIGIILILEFYKINKYLHLPTILFINVLITSVVSLGYEASIIISLSPILLYYLLNFLKNNDLISFIFFLVFYIFIFSQLPLLSLSYFFSPFHFIFFLYLSSVIYNYFFRSNYFEKKYKNFFSFSKYCNYPFLFLTISVLIIISFNLSFFLIALDTHALTGSVSYDGVPVSRLDNILSPVKFFKTFIPDARCIFENFHHTYQVNINNKDCTISNFLSYFFNFNKNEWMQAPVFIGFTSILVSLFGLIFSKHQEKWYFFFTVVFIVALQGPRDVLFGDINFYANLFTAFLNPFSFLIQHTHMIILMAPVFLIPLFVMGIEVISEKISQKKFLKEKILLVLSLFLILLFLILIKEKVGFNVIFFYIIIVALLFLINKTIKYNNKQITLFLIFICFFVDTYALNIYFQKAPRGSAEKFLPVYILNGVNRAKHHIDNPNPFNTSLPLEIVSKKPIVKLNSEYNNFENFIYKNLSFSKNLYIGEFYKTNFFYRFLEEPIIYEIRHRSYKKISEYKDLNYFKNNFLLVNFFDKVSDINNVDLKYFFQNKKLFNNNIYLSDVDHKKLINISEDPISRKNFEKIEIRINENDLKLVREINGSILYKFEKPKKIPNYLNGSIFSDPSTIELNINNQPLKLSHDNLFLENTFNIHSTQNNYFYFLLNKNLTPKKIIISFKKFLLIDNFERKADNFIFNMNLKKDGWLLIKFPYDKNWQIFLDGNKTKIYKANEYWLGIQVSKNTKIMEVKYSLNRYGINQLSLIFYYLSMVYIIIFLFRFYSVTNK